MKNRIEECRKKAGIMSEALGEAVGLSPSEMYHCETDDLDFEDLTLSKLEEMARILNVAPAYLAGWTDRERNIVYPEGAIVYINTDEKYVDLQCIKFSNLEFMNCGLVFGITTSGKRGFIPFNLIRYIEIKDSINKKGKTHDS
ncbi:helix-turn-helix domain-containing protein [Limosilactobacillus reuteri]|uniref:helix-turn-helix domain-containing protein n=1 Tax=Limosilactobacillus reuteri TaxID=1598 RepID=UPI001E569985|nr:helix-turn-helix transcriptional regulator [Limosilactobacillus reuteri]MCC4501908.1 helix-turn-helix domain-containing protein [Limosilactobacillus reuteri]